jgi:hypothetical protein
VGASAGAATGRGAGRKHLFSPWKRLELAGITWICREKAGNGEDRMSLTRIGRRLLTQTGPVGEKLKVRSKKQKSKGGSVAMMPPTGCGVFGGLDGGVSPK